MARTPITKQQGWVEVSSISCTLQNASGFYVDVLPAFNTPISEKGLVFTPWQLENFDLDDGKRLYVRNNNDHEINVEVV